MKGQISISLTWMFALFAGVVVFVFLLNFADISVTQSEFETSIEVLDNIDTQITSISGRKNTFAEFSTPNVRLNNFCEEWETSGLLLEGSGDVRPKTHQAIFSEEVLEGRDFLAWTQDWNLQSEVDRFLYLSTPETVFVIVRDEDGEAERFFNELAPEFPKGVVEYDEITEYNRRGFDTYVFIFLDEGQEINMARNEIPVAGSGAEIKARKILENDDYGDVEFWRLESSWVREGDSGWTGNALKFGAVFSEGLDHYECNREKAYERLERIAGINQERADLLAERFPEGNECRGALEDASEMYGDILEGVEDADNQKISESAAELRDIERDLRRGRNCPTL